MWQKIIYLFILSDVPFLTANGLYLIHHNIVYYTASDVFHHLSAM